MRTPVLETERLLLRPVTAADAEAVWQWASDKRVNEYMSYPLHQTMEDTLAFLKMEEENLNADNLYDFGFVLKETGELIGTGGLGFNKNYELWELGYNLRYDCWNMGYTTEAAAEILKFGKEQLRIHKFLGRHAKENPASGRVLEKNGFIFAKEGLMKKTDGSRNFQSKEYILYACNENISNLESYSEVERYYDEMDEWGRLARHLVEFEVTKRYMDTYIESNQKILDIGGGPGRYSIYLTQKGNEVTLLDLSGKNIRQAVEKAEEAGVHLDSCIHGDALRLNEYLYKKEQFDAVLLMGPLYHLLKEEERKKSLQQALSMLKPGGIIFAAFISTYAPMHDYAGELYDFGDIDHLLHYLKDGTNHGDAAGFTTSYFCSEEEARALIEEEGVTELAFAGVENILCGKEELLRGLSEEQQEKWLELAWRLSRDKKLLGMSEHFLYIGRK